MRLGSKQELFQRLMVQFKTWILEQGYEIRGGDAFRDPRVHGEIGEQLGYGHRNSCHKYKLAEDLYLRHGNGDMFRTFDEYVEVGEHWESMDELCCWGGRFKSVDCVHFSLMHEGMS